MPRVRKGARLVAHSAARALGRLDELFANGGGEDSTDLIGGDRDAR